MLRLMSCLHPLHRSIFDYRLQKMVSIDVPCGHCLSCKQAFRRAWEFRVRKTAESCSDGFIYDTLTVRPQSMPFLDYSEIKSDGCIYYPPEYFSYGAAASLGVFREISPDVQRILEHYNFKVPYFPRSFVSRWIKLARERYKKATGKRLNLRYVIVLEYGPKWSRPHMHCMFFGISLADYVTYFQKPWKALFGFTKTKHIKNTSDAQKVASYLSKYFTKGDFESPLVKVGLLPNAWRLISHGVGIEYLQSSRLSGLSAYLGLSPKLLQLAMNISVDDKDKALVQNLCSMVDLAISDLDRDSLFHLVDKVSVAYIGSYPLSLPRYYKDKLFKCNSKSCLYEILSHHLRTYSDNLRFKKLSEYVAGALGKSVDEVSAAFANNSLSFAYWVASFNAYRKRQNLVRQASRKVIDRNVYKGRPLSNPYFDELEL